ncbi:uncharacterized protein LOC129600020 isoform X2 [Paramacrobiotus metropolitanus]|uniref:uncharacterized protein LOC129600020 isoform X2 n=1 Tax=Paramacrobiotus metropolitanus TaxID=2943436 RepID=UPI002445C73B|nr:uncharacterized protein LOC129600020 isoform X2 [Paramacrobiotus metropolitanus]
MSSLTSTLGNSAPDTGTPSFCHQYYYGANDFIHNGRYGVIYKATLTNNLSPACGASVAIKVMHLFPGSYDDEEKFTRSFKVIKQLRHANLLVYHDIRVFSTENGTTIEYMMDYCSDKNLGGRIARFQKHAMIPSATTVLTQMNHADEKLLIGSLDNVVHQLDEATQSSRIDKNFDECASPEILKYFRREFMDAQNMENIAVPGMESDIWSLGCIFLQLANCIIGRHEMAFCRDGRRPVVESGLAFPRYVVLILEGFSPYISEVLPDAIRSCICDCLRRNIQQRITAPELDSRLTKMITDLELPQESTICDEFLTSDFDYSYVIDISRGCIGRGSNGAVYKVHLPGHNSFSQGTAAVKVINFNEEDAPGSDRYAKLQKKYEKLVRLKHTNLVKYYQAKLIKGEHGLTVQLLMDYHCGGSFRSLLKKWTDNQFGLNPVAALRYTLEITDGLNFLHGQRVWHGDLKPSNILVKTIDEDITLQICDLDDFVLMDLGSTNARGTPIYMSPEMIARVVGSTDVMPGERTDIWSLGCVMLDIGLCAAGEGKRELWNRHLNHRHEISEQTSTVLYALWINEQGYVPFIPDTVSRNFASYIESCFFINPDDRISAAALKVHLQDHMEAMYKHVKKRNLTCNSREQS